MHWFGLFAAVLIISLDFIFFLDNEKMLLFLAGIGIGLAALPFVVGIAIENKKEEQMNEMFLEFSRNLAEAVSAGTPISKSIINMKNNNYGSLSPYIVRLSNQTELGIPVDLALKTFANDLGSPVIKRAVALIREAEKAGGEIDYILNSTAKAISEVEKLKKERKAAIYNLVIQGYIIFFIFSGIILIMEFKIVPLTAEVSGFGSIGFNVESFKDPSKVTPEENFTLKHFTRPFLYLLLTQSFFAGLVIGKLTEGSIKKGVKHSFVLMISSFLISTGARLFWASA